MTIELGHSNFHQRNPLDHLQDPQNVELLSHKPSSPQVTSRDPESTRTKMHANNRKSQQIESCKLNTIQQPNGGNSRSGSSYSMEVRVSYSEESERKPSKNANVDTCYCYCSLLLAAAAAAAAAANR